MKHVAAGIIVFEDGRLTTESTESTEIDRKRSIQLTYMKLSGIGTGLLINFNVQRLADGIDRFRI